MNQDKLYKIFAILSISCGVMGLTVGKYILGGVLVMLGAAIFYNRARGGYNARNMYDKQLAGDITIDELYRRIRDIMTPLGKCWLGTHKGMDGQVIVFGPSYYKDYIVISEKSGKIELKSGSNISDISSDDGIDRFSEVADVANLEVTPQLYSGFAAYKLATSMLLDDLVELIAGINAGECEIPQSMGVFKLYRYNSYDNVVRDTDENEYATCFAQYEPFTATVSDADGELITKIVANSSTTKYRNPKDGYAFEMEGALYGTIFRDLSGSRDRFSMESPDGLYEMIAFPAVRRGNLSCNYEIKLNGVRKAIVAGTARVEFQQEGLVENDVIMSYDDDYLIIYIALQDFMMTTNRFLR